MYSQEYNSWFPYNCTSQRTVDPGRIHISLLLSPYLHTNKAFKCQDENEGLWESEGSSYIWNWMQIDLPGNERAGKTQYNAVPYGVVPGSSFPILLDAGAYHGPTGVKKSFNVLFANWRVSDAAELPF